MSASRRSSFVNRVAAAAALAAWAYSGELSTSAPPPPPAEVTAMWVTDVDAGAQPVPVGGRTVPPEALPGQKPARGGKCGHPDQVAIGGGCWVETAKKPQPPPARCGDFFEHEGRCYLPILQAPKVPTTTSPR